MGLFIRKPFSLLQAEASASGQGTLRRVLGPIGLVALESVSSSAPDSSPSPEP